MREKRMIRHPLAVAATGLVLLGGCGHNTQPAAAPPAQVSQPAPSPEESESPSAAASPSPAMSRKQACQQVVESAIDFTYLAVKTKDNPTLEGIDSGELRAVTRKIREAVPFLDAKTAGHARALTYPLDTMAGVIDSGVDTTIDFEAALDAVPAVMKGCRGKANLKDYVSPYQS